LAAARGSRSSAGGWLLVASVTATLLCLACTRDAGPQVVRGLVVDLRAVSINQLAAFDLRADDGRSLSFAVEGDVGMTPGHLREHMVLGEPVTVTYRETRGTLVASRVED
jgi:hypothetical protein